MENFTGNKEESASGFVIEAKLDSKRGIQAILIIKNGTLKKGMIVVVGDSFCTTNIMENFKGETISEATFSSPIRLVGFCKIPKIGAEFKSFENKKDAEKYMKKLPSRLSGTPLIKEEKHQLPSLRRRGLEVVSKNNSDHSKS